MEGVVKEYLLPIIKATLFAICVTLVSILLFALIVKITTFSHLGVKVVNQFIKIVAIFLGCFFFIKEGKGLVKGGVIGLLYWIFINLIFAMISKVKVRFSIIELVLCLLIGIISGIISVNVKEKGQ